MDHPDQYVDDPSARIDPKGKFIATGCPSWF
jgi:hypothetical protein